MYDPSASMTTVEPLYQWQTVHAFDTAAACEDAQAGMVKSYEKELSANPTNEHALKGFTEFSDARCIASNDPRLKGK